MSENKKSNSLLDLLEMQGRLGFPLASSKISCPESASRNRMADTKEEQVDIIIDQMMESTNSGGFLYKDRENSFFKFFLSNDEELLQDGCYSTDEERVQWYAKHIHKQLMRMDNISLTLLYNVIVVMDSVK